MECCNIRNNAVECTIFFLRRKYDAKKTSGWYKLDEITVPLFYMKDIVHMLPTIKRLGFHSTTLRCSALYLFSLKKTSLPFWKLNLWKYSILLLYCQCAVAAHINSCGLLFKKWNNKRVLGNESQLQMDCAVLLRLAREHSSFELCVRVVKKVWHEFNLHENNRHFNGWYIKRPPESKASNPNVYQQQHSRSRGMRL